MDTINAEFAGEAIASSRDPQHWGRAMASAVSRLVAQLEAVPALGTGEALLSRNLTMRITEDGPGVRIVVSLEPDLLDANRGVG